MMRHWKNVAILLSVGSIVPQPTAVTRAEPVAEGPVATASGEPVLRKILEATRGVIARQKAYQVRVQSTWEAGPDDEPITGEKEYVLTLVRPANIRLTITSQKNEEPDLVVIGNERTLFTYLPARQVYSTGPMLGPRAGLERNVVIAQSLIGSGLEIVARPDATAFVLAQASNIVDRGVETNKDGIKGRHFSLTWGEARIQVWFSDEPEPKLIRFSRSTKLPTADGGNYRTDIESNLTWDFAPTVTADMFRPGHPVSARKVRDLYEFLAGNESDLAPGSITDVELMDLEGNVVRLGEIPDAVALVVDSWSPEAPALVEKFAARVRKQAKDRAALVVVVADEVADAERVAPRATGLRILHDRLGDVPFGLGVEAVPIIATWREDSTPWQREVDAATLEKSLDEALAR